MIDASIIAGAYDNLAAGYDRELAKDEWIRRLLWRRFDRLFRAGDRVIDAGCGTGIDALHLAERGVRVTAVDASPGMLASLRAKAAGRFGDAALATVLGELNAVLTALSGTFDGIVSSFAALNTVALDEFAASAARLVRPGGHVVCHMLAPGYHGHRLALLLTSTGRLRRSQPRPVQVRLADQRIDHSNLDPRDVYERFFATSFERSDCHAVGLLVSPAIERHASRRLLDLLGAAEAVIGRLPPLVTCGRFFVLDLVRRR
ncbi:MAG TPA: class I SAM-dependent methyltransferase [Polyangia bacterium]|jgi:SAM-dependent methyltransferase|nr:class I SAM-dependent methyltransferase [Polyangia bacterium]